MFADELHPDGHVVREASRQGQGWDSCGICGDNVNIGEIHFERVAGLFAELEGSGGAGGGEENVNG